MIPQVFFKRREEKRREKRRREEERREGKRREEKKKEKRRLELQTAEQMQLRSIAFCTSILHFCTLSHSPWDSSNQAIGTSRRHKLLL